MYSTLVQEANQSEKKVKIFIFYTEDPKKTPLSYAAHRKQANLFST